MNFQEDFVVLERRRGATKWAFRFLLISMVALAVSSILKGV